MLDSKPSRQTRAKGEVFEHLPHLFSSVYVPPAVRLEVLDPQQGRPGASELVAALGTWITEVQPDPALVVGYPALPSVADRELLAVAQGMGVDYLLTADRALCREARARGVTCLSTAQVVVLMKDLGLINAVKPVLQLMQQRGFGIATADYQQALAAAGEQP